MYRHKHLNLFFSLIQKKKKTFLGSVRTFGTGPHLIAHPLRSLALQYKQIDSQSTPRIYSKCRHSTECAKGKRGSYLSVFAEKVRPKISGIAGKRIKSRCRDVERRFRGWRAEGGNGQCRERAVATSVVRQRKHKVENRVSRAAICGIMARKLK